MDLGAGTGALSACLPPGSICAELRRERAEVGARAMPWYDWRVADVLERPFVEAVVWVTWCHVSAIVDFSKSIF
jgi:hypothetical protein